MTMEAPPTGNTGMTALEGLSQLDRRALMLSMQLDTPEKQRAYQQVLLEKWSGVDKHGKYNPLCDWLGQGSVDRGYPKISEERDKLIMAVVLENQQRFQRSKELQVVNGRVPITQDTTTADAALATRFVLPIVRRVYAQVIQGDWTSVQPLVGPSGYIYYIDFVRENLDGSLGVNILSVDYTWMLKGELTVPPKAKLVLQRDTIQVQKQIMGMAWSLEVMEDAQAQLAINVEQELMNAFTEEFVRTLLARHLNRIYNSAGLAATGTQLPPTWAAGPAAVQFPNRGANSVTDYKQIIYGYLLDGDTQFRRANRVPANGIVAGYGLAGFLSKLLTATATPSNDADDLTSGIGITNYGTYAERFRIWGTEFLPDNMGFLYRRSPDPLRAGFVYSPYIPVQVMPLLYGDYDSTTGNYQNKDAWTRNIRERSGEKVVRPYAFQTILGPAGGLAQWG